MALLTFNCSVAGDKSFLETYTHDMQIMPSDTKILTDSQIGMFPMIKEWRDSVIHTSYITRPFSDHVQTGKTNTIKHIILKYIELATKIKFKYVLIHLPSTQKEMDCLGDGMSIIHELFKNPKIIPLLEIPAWKSGFKMDIYKYFEQILSFRKTIPHMQICLDTAHLYSNGLEIEDIITLYDTLRDVVSVIHLNGNENNMWKSDKHIALFDDKNKLKNYAKLLQHICKDDILLVSENTTHHASYAKWELFVNTYHVDIVPYIDRLST